jgi:hypothetical protein
MRVYYAGGAHYPFLEGKPILESFWYKQNALRGMRLTDDFFLDSGAYSAFTQGKEIRIDDYAAFIHEVQGQVSVAASLDVIGDAEASFTAYLTLLDKGCPVIPVFHIGDDFKYLDEYLAMDVTYLALGGMVGKQSSILREWLDKVWGKWLTDAAGKPITKVHGFGLTVGHLLERYPWYTADSTTWLNGTRFGTALFNFPGRRLVHIPISERNPALKQGTSNHIRNLSPFEYAIAMQELEEANTTLDLISTDNNELLRFNARTFERWAVEYGPAKTFHNLEQGFFS